MKEALVKRKFRFEEEWETVKVGNLQPSPILEFYSARIVHIIL